MAKYLSMDHLRFLLFDVHDVASILTYERYQDFDLESIRLMLSSAKDLADKELYPFFTQMDEDPVRFEDGKVIVHPQVKRIFEVGAENGWIGTHFDYEHGGIQLPHTVFAAANHIFQAANNSAVGYLGLTTGAANLITSFGSKALLDTYVPKMLAGDWAGTMALTEPQAGSSLSDITTSASLNSDGSYAIKGQKIFISGGDHEYAENFIHLTLARIEGAPAGTKGISLFVVPKHRPDGDGGLENNDVVTVGDFQKMGQKGYATTHLAYGENDNCKGWLLGEANKGLKYMFQMMNGARIDVGLTAASTATAAYYASLQYAKERPQGRKLNKSGEKDSAKEQTLIINHPDVKRMLFLQKSIVEGALSLLMECTRLHDLSIVETGEAKENAHLLLEILTPVAKTYPAEMGKISISNGLQVLGGYGFCTDFPLQQYYRDIRIMSLYEGTTGIQSLDLLGRKIVMKNGKALMLLLAEISKAIEAANEYDSLRPYATELSDKLKDTQKVLEFLMPFAMSGNYERYLADASVFMDLASTVIIGWQWLKMATQAETGLAGERTDQSKAFYQSKIHTMKFYFKYEMPKTLGLVQTILDQNDLTIFEQDDVEF